MKKIIPWIVSALAGLIFIFLLNASPLSRLDISIELPFGWHTDTGSQVCVFNEPRPNNEGLPFSMSRAKKLPECGLEYNNQAKLLNGLTGIVLGVLYISVSSKLWSKRNQNSSNI